MKMQEYKRSEHVMVRFTKKHLAMIRKEAEKQGYYPSSWVRAVVLKELKEKDIHDEV